MRIRLTIAIIFAVTSGAYAGDHRRTEPRNYILRRQQAYQVQGVPTSRLIIGKRQIDVYRNGLMFEGDHVVGVRAR
jgi:hypothetical protein